MTIRPWNFIRTRNATKLAILCGMLAAQLAVASPCRKSSSCGELAKVARAAYAARRHEEALHKFESVYIISGSPIMLVHMGCALHALGRYEEAIAKFRQFLRQRANSSHAPTVRKYLQQSLSQHAAAAPAAPPPFVGETPRFEKEESSLPAPGRLIRALPIAPPIFVTSLPPPIDQRSSARRIRLITVGAVAVSLGVLGVIAGAGCYGAVVSLEDRFRATGDEFIKRELHTQALLIQKASTASYIAGGLITGLGLGLLSAAGDVWLRSRRASPAIPKLSMDADSQAVSARMEGSF